MQPADDEQRTNDVTRHTTLRYVAIGDSFTEGVGDEDPDAVGGVRGWADRVAEVLAAQTPGFEYANLAVRGKLIGAIVDEQLEHGIALRPDLVSFCAGGNDILRPGSDPDAVAEAFSAALDRLAPTGARIVVFTGCDVGHTPVFNLIRGKVAVYNEHIRVAAARHGAMVVDQWACDWLADSRMWSADRLHLSPLGHQNMAVEVLDTLGVPHHVSRTALEPLPERPWVQSLPEDVAWARQYLWPWVVRRLRHRSSADGRSPKRPALEPLLAAPPTPDDQRSAPSL